MSFRATCVALLLSSLPIAGCGTIANIATVRPEKGGKTPFGGVRTDLACLKKAENGELNVGRHQKSESEPNSQLGLVFLYAADLPLSFIGDVVTWPYTATYSFINQPTPLPPFAFTPPLVTQSAPEPAPDPMQTPVPPGIQLPPIPALPLPPPKPTDLLKPSDLPKPTDLPKMGMP